ncbi:MAG: hypothetical protein M1318_05960 [Firmicutes bacterium]|jgi:hypothetical protein|nr:hypothetical protein [Bacillota bacterium]
MVHLAMECAAWQPLVSVAIIQVDQFPERGQKFNILGVPTTILEPGTQRLQGVVPAPYFAGYLLQAQT